MSDRFTKYSTPGFAAPEEDEEIPFDPEESDTETPRSLNTILYGPPGTGKTYNAINYALAIIEGKQPEELEAESRVNRKAVKKRFDDACIHDWENVKGRIG